MIQADQALRGLLLLELIGKERKSRVMDLLFDEGQPAGLDSLPERSYRAASAGAWFSLLESSSSSKAATSQDHGTRCSRIG